LGRPLTEAEVLRHTSQGTIGICPAGLTLDQLARLAGRLPHGQATLLRDLGYAQFQEILRGVNEPGNRYVINFHRLPLFGQGGEHFSPIAGYLEDRDLVLVLDVNARYRPFLVRSERLFAAMDTVDAASGQRRGLLVLR
jgi:hypothetical protein